MCMRLQYSHRNLRRRTRLDAVPEAIDRHRQYATVENLYEMAVTTHTLAFKRDLRGAPFDPRLWAQSRGGRTYRIHLVATTLVP